MSRDEVVKHIDHLIDLVETQAGVRPVEYVADMIQTEIWGSSSSVAELPHRAS